MGDYRDDFDISISACMSDHNRMDVLTNMEKFETNEKKNINLFFTKIIQYVDQNKKLSLELDMVDKINISS
jgi:hypothetical protein